MLNVLLWYVKQMFPLTYWTTYSEGKETRFAMWKMWLGRSYRCVDFKIKQ